MTRRSLVIALALLAPTAARADAVDFERHVMGLLGRMGCASGSCHGSFQGKGGFQLSLFGYDPAKDFAAIARDSNGRRIDLANPDRSLLLLKATGEAPHGGSVRFGKSSWQYRMLRDWIARGAKWKAGSGDAISVSVTPGEAAMTRPGDVAQLKVVATFAGDAREDITKLCDYRTNDDAVAEVSNLGKIKTLRPGETSIIVSYRGNVMPVRVLVPTVPKPGFVYPEVPESNFIDGLVFAKLRRLNMVPSDLSSDTEFLRRVTLDTIGTLPTPEEVRAFLADKSADKRTKKIDELLAHPMHAALWATKLCDITGNNTDALEQPQQRKTHYSRQWHDWFRVRVAKNMPYDAIVKNVLTATSREGKSAKEYIDRVDAEEKAQDDGKKTTYADRETLDLFWRRQGKVPIDQWGEKTAAAFLGVRLECAQCHKHPFDRWSQADYRGYANIFATVAHAVSPASAAAFKEANAERSQRTQQKLQEAKKKGDKFVGLPVVALKEVFLGKPAGLLPHPDTGAKLAPKALGGPEIHVKAGDDPRMKLWQWMREKDNPFFARSFVNRVWGHYFGTGIVHPVDDFSLANPPSNPALLDALAKSFVESGYDIRAMERAVLLSRTYQLTSKPNETNKFDKVNFARGYARPMLAEVVVDALNAALGASEKWAVGEADPGARAIEVGASKVANANVNYIFRTFGRPPRTTACDCERSADPALPQKLFLMADPNMAAKLKAGTRVRDVLKAKADDGEALEELFLATLSRRPTQRERDAMTEYRNEKMQDLPKGMAPAAKRLEVFNDVLWALVNTKEFILNH